MSFILTEDAALKAHLTGMTVADEKTSSRPVKVYFGVPDIEIGKQEYPYIVLNLIDVRYATYRKARGGAYVTTERQIGEISGGAHGVYVRSYPEPYDLVYQIASYARHPRHDRLLLAHLNKKLPGNNGLMALTEQDCTDVYRPIFVDQFIKNDSIEGGGAESRRLFRNIFTVRVPTELDPELVSATQQILTTHLNTNPQIIPKGYDKV